MSALPDGRNDAWELPKRLWGTTKQFQERARQKSGAPQFTKSQERRLNQEAKREEEIEEGRKKQKMKATRAKGLVQEKAKARAVQRQKGLPLDGRQQVPGQSMIQGYLCGSKRKAEEECGSDRSSSEGGIEETSDRRERCNSELSESSDLRNLMDRKRVITDTEPAVQHQYQHRSCSVSNFTSPPMIPDPVEGKEPKLQPRPKIHGSRQFKRPFRQQHGLLAEEEVVRLDLPDVITISSDPPEQKDSSTGTLSPPWSGPGPSSDYHYLAFTSQERRNAAELDLCGIRGLKEDDEGGSNSKIAEEVGKGEIRELFQQDSGDPSLDLSQVFGYTQDPDWEEVSIPEESDRDAIDREELSLGEGIKHEGSTGEGSQDLPPISRAAGTEEREDGFVQDNGQRIGETAWGDMSDDFGSLGLNPSSLQQLGI